MLAMNVVLACTNLAGNSKLICRVPFAKESGIRRFESDSAYSVQTVDLPFGSVAISMFMCSAYCCLVTTLSKKQTYWRR